MSYFERLPGCYCPCAVYV